MRKIFSSLFVKYMLIFVGIMVLSNIVATITMFFLFGIDFRVATRIAAGGDAPPITRFAFGLGGFTFAVGAVCIFVAVKMLVRPIKQISIASKLVASGDFDVSVEVFGKDEVSELARNFNIMTASLSKNEYLHKDFVSNVSHEFKTPLTSLQGYAKLLKKDNLSDEKRRECVDIIIAETERLSKMSSHLLRLSELDNQTISAQRECFRLDEQIRSVLVFLQDAWEKKGISVDAKMEKISFRGDKELIYQVWVNLISNAINYSLQNGALNIKAYQREKIVIEIQDSGIGMTQEEARRAFDRFYKADSSRNSSGTGLGLPVCKKIVELHSGTISVQSAPEKGSRFIVNF